MGQPGIVILVLMVITLIVLVTGVIVMARGGKLNRMYSNKLMSLRVVFQALTIVAVALIYFLMKK
ncbi:MAG: twin transmembrane helix small protein [Sphingobacteriia bacterium]|nr:twin transmembrane helix small protein [Sphingobacteriia bacterium]